MRVNALRGLWTLMKIGPQISRAAAAKPDGLLRHEIFLFSLLPPHAGIRQYWRDFDALERWARTLPHQTWWRNFLHDSEGTAFWHETYFMRGGIEAIYDDLIRAARTQQLRTDARREGPDVRCAPAREHRRVAARRARGGRTRHSVRAGVVVTLNCAGALRRP
jgi:hypothetical protein